MNLNWLDWKKQYKQWVARNSVKIIQEPQSIITFNIRCFSNYKISKANHDKVLYKFCEWYFKKKLSFLIQVLRHFFFTLIFKIAT